MKTAIFILIIALILSLIGNFVQWDLSRDQDTKLAFQGSQSKIALDESLRARDSVERAADAQILILRSERKADSTKAAKREVGFKSTVSRQDRQITALRDLRASQGISPDTLSQQIEVTQDSTIKAQAAEIEALRVDNSVCKKSFQTEIEALNDKLTAERTANLKAIDHVEVLEKQNLKLRKGNKVLKVVVIVLGSYIVLDKAMD